jgi:hypothetical protein
MFHQNSFSAKIIALSLDRMNNSKEQTHFSYKELVPQLFKKEIQTSETNSYWRTGKNRRTKDKYP